MERPNRAPARGLMAALALALASGTARGESGKISKERLVWHERERTYSLYVPAGVDPREKVPLLILLHGSGRNGETLVSKWKEKADKEKIVLLGPDSFDSIHWGSPIDGPLFLHDVIEQVNTNPKLAIDGRRVYLFGHSAGAVFALQMAALESEYFAAAVIHAGALDPRFFTIFDAASRKIPYAIFIGTRDAFFPLEAVSATRDALKARGFPVEYTEIPGHTHDYSSRSSEINDKAWDFFRKNPLPADPKYTVYKDPD